MAGRWKDWNEAARGEDALDIGLADSGLSEGVGVGVLTGRGEVKDGVGDWVGDTVRPVE